MRAKGRVRVAAALLAAACGPEFDFPDPEPTEPGTQCVFDSDCIPDACCGQGSSAVHVSKGPSCSAEQCDGSCPANSVDCGCGIPVCRDARCVVARTVSPECPER